MKFLRTSYFLYLSLLPALAMGALGQISLDSVSRWWFVALFLGVIIFLEAVAELIPYPTALSAAVVTTLSVPVQVILALANFQNIWLIFAYQFLIEAAGALVGIAIYGLFYHHNEHSKLSTHKVIGIKILVAGMLLVWPAWAVVTLFGPLFTQLTWSWNTIFLVTALLSAIYNTIRRMQTSDRLGNDEYFGYIIIGIFVFIFGGPFFYHLVK